jgi:hypothetical protein
MKSEIARLRKRTPIRTCIIRKMRFVQSAKA